jgi:hypothetical protein
MFKEKSYKQIFSYVIEFMYGASLYAYGDSIMYMGITLCIQGSPCAYRD